MVINISYIFYPINLGCLALNTTKSPELWKINLWVITFLWELSWQNQFTTIWTLESKQCVTDVQIGQKWLWMGRRLQGRLFAADITGLACLMQQKEGQIQAETMFQWHRQLEVGETHRDFLKRKDKITWLMKLCPVWDLCLHRSSGWMKCHASPGELGWWSASTRSLHSFPGGTGSHGKTEI